MNRARAAAGFFLLAALLALAPASAAALELEIGGSFGVARSTIGGDSPPGSSFSPRVSGSAAIACDIRLSPELSLLLEPGYSVNGAKVSVEQLDNPEKVDLLDVRFPYVALPIDLRVYRPGGRLFAVGGLDFRWLQKPEATLLVSPGTVTDLTDRVSSFDLALNMGAGYTIPWKPVHFVLEARYSQGLVNLDQGAVDHVHVPFPLRLRTSGLGLILRVMIPLHLGSEGGGKS